MNSLIRNLTKFIGTVLELYAPLPFQFTADLHTLNAYLRSYSENQEKLLEGFVDQLSQKLDKKMKNVSSRPNSNFQCEDNSLRHYNSCTFKYPQLKLNFENQSSEQINFTYNPIPQPQTKPIYSQRNINCQEGGIKSNRHKFGSKHRNRIKQNNSQIDKENLSFTFNIKEKEFNPKSLLSNKSQIQLISLNSNHSVSKLHNQSLKDKQEQSKRLRYDSNDSRTNTSSLKIKLRPKPSIDPIKIKQGVQAILQLFSSHNTEIKQLFESLQTFDEQAMLSATQ